MTREILAPAKDDVDAMFDSANIPWLKELLTLLEGHNGDQSAGSCI